MIFNIEYRQEILRQVIFVSSILAGFSFTVVAQFLSEKEKNKYLSLSIRTFIASTTFLLVATVGGALLLFSMVLLHPDSSVELMNNVDGMFGFLLIIFILGLVFFMTGMAIAGWIHSKSVGIFAITASVLACLIMFGFYSFVAQIFLPQ